MKWILYLGVIFVLIFGCLGNNTPKTETKFTEEQSKELAIQSVKATAEYKIGGKDLKITNSQKLNCESCWSFDLSFATTNELGGNSYYSATVTVNNGKAGSVSVEKLIGGDTDSHGCIGAAGYTWCEEKQKCIRSWEENCTTIVGNDRDEHGCIGSAGYTWCESKQACIRSWEEECIAPGGDRDVHGCIPSAGYSWCEQKQKCLRLWEEPCSLTATCAPSEVWCTPLQKCIKPWEQKCE